MISIRRSAGASSTCKALLGNAGAALAPSLYMLMPHLRRIWDGEVDGRGQGAVSLQTSRNPYPPYPRRTESAAAAASQDPHELGTHRARIHVRMRGQASLLRTTARGLSVCHLHAKCVPPLYTASVGRKRKAEE
ncbi:hypothetical protein K438DRAFT_1849659, partial [Mycena galopus ATCC 62051]